MPVRFTHTHDSSVHPTLIDLEETSSLPADLEETSSLPAQDESVHAQALMMGTVSCATATGKAQSSLNTGRGSRLRGLYS